MLPALPEALWCGDGALAQGLGKNGRIASNIASATAPYSSHNVAEFCPSRFEPSASKPVNKIPSPGPANTRAPRCGRPAAIANGWLRLVIITNTQALATPVPKRNNRCGKKPWAQYDTNVSSTHSHSPAYSRLLTW